jgi:hypothetical protein
MPNQISNVKTRALPAEPNGPALSCDDENFQHAPNEMSSRSIFLIPPELYPPWILHHAYFVSLSAWLYSNVNQ